MEMSILATSPWQRGMKKHFGFGALAAHTKSSSRTIIPFRHISICGRRTPNTNNENQEKKHTVLSPAREEIRWRSQEMRVHLWVCADENLLVDCGQEKSILRWVRLQIEALKRPHADHLLDALIKSFSFKKFVYWGSAGLFSPIQRHIHIHIFRL